MRGPSDIKIQFHVEPSDTTVGIMTEGFTAFVQTDDPASMDGAQRLALSCTLSDIVTERCQWWNEENGALIDPPPFAPLVEAALVAFARAWYKTG